MDTTHSSREKGFTLLEISIVLIIIGLIVGGVLVGRDLIYSAQLRNVISEIQQLTTAITTYKVKYNCLPGDCGNATNFFGTASNCSSFALSGGTCNGNDDGFIEAWWSGTHWTNTIEALNGLQQLSLAGLIKGNFTGGRVQNLGGVSQNLLATNLVPISSFNPAIGYYPFTMDEGHPVPRPATYALHNVVQVGALTINTTTNDFLSGPAFNALQAYLLDAKSDDGKASGGKWQSVDGFASYPSYINPYTTCLSGTDYSTSANTGCLLYYSFDIP